jgi:hypothetical protein
MVVVFGLSGQSFRTCLPARMGDGRFEATQIGAGVSPPVAVARPLHELSAGADPACHPQSRPALLAGTEGRHGC